MIVFLDFVHPCGFKDAKKKCKGCHNPETWDINGGQKIDNNEIISKLKKALCQNGIMRDLSILGGEPFLPENRADCAYILSEVKKAFPTLKVYIWTGYTYEELLSENDANVESILKSIDILVDGPFIEELKGVYKLRGSSNQRILKFKNGALLE